MSLLADRELVPAAALPAGFYARPVAEVARDLLGMIVVSQRPEGLTAGRIVETEAYGGQDDPASHAAFRRGGVVRAMWGPAGTVYVYRAYGVYPCLNVVTGPEGEPSAVLIRAIEPLAGLDLMIPRTGRPAGPRLASGPGLLGRALGVTTADNGHPLWRPPLWIQAGTPPEQIERGPRIGVSRGRDQEWRFGWRAHPALSRPFPRSRS